MFYPDFLYPSMFSKRAASPKSLSSVSKSGSFEDDLDPVAGLSSAAACISLSLPSEPHDPDGPITSHYLFSPTFTHQCFDNEHIRGYEPTDAAQERSIDQANRQRQKMRTLKDSKGLEGGHVSFRHHVRATHQLDLSIRLSPSCRQCAILIITQPKEKRTGVPLAEVQTTNKKRKRAHVDVSAHPVSSSSTHSSYSSACCSSSAASFSSSSSVSHPNIQAGRTRHRRMGTDEILSKLAKGLPMPRFVSHDDGGEQTKTVFTVSHPFNASGSLEHISSSPPKKKMCHKDGIKDPTRDIPTEICPSSTNESSFTFEQEEDNILHIIENDYLENVMGTILSEYSSPIRTVNGLDCSLLSPSLSFGDNEGVGDFVLTLADGTDPKVKEYHDQVQKLSLWFIENADGVNVGSTEGGGSWQILYLFRKHPISVEQPRANAATSTSTPYKIKPTPPSTLLSPLQAIFSPARKMFHDTFSGILGGEKKRIETSTLSSPSKQTIQYKYSLVGYMTLFSFSSPFKKPKGGIIQRVCQVVILPPFQRAGHGKKMLQAVYDNAKCSPSSNPSQPEIVEINVEDPAPAFVALRDSVDYQLIRDNCMATLATQGGRAIFNSSTNKKDDTSIIPPKYLEPDCMDLLSTADATHAAILAKITPRQIQVAYEIYKLETVLKRKISQNNNEGVIDASSNQDSNECKIAEEDDMEKKWNIMVKKRLNVSHKEIIGACPSKDAKKAKLSQLFDETVHRYRTILGLK